jgi:hypothetical protein
VIAVPVFLSSPASLALHDGLGSSRHDKNRPLNIQLI